MLAARALDALEHFIEHIALADMHRIVALKDDRAALARHAGRVIRAVVRADVDVHVVHRIVSLRVDAVEQLADDVFLVARGDEDGNAVVFIAAGEFFPLQQRHRHIEELIGIAYEK